jgi:hypothetical protein
MGTTVSLAALMTAPVCCYSGRAAGPNGYRWLAPVLSSGRASYGHQVGADHLAAFRFRALMKNHSPLAICEFPD